MPQQTDLQWTILVYRDRKTHHGSGFAVDVMTAADP